MLEKVNFCMVHVCQTHVYGQFNIPNTLNPWQTFAGPVKHRDHRRMSSIPAPVEGGYDEKNVLTGFNI